MHICDWYETFLHISPSESSEMPTENRNNSSDVPPLDSINQWEALQVPYSTKIKEK